MPCTYTHEQIRELRVGEAKNKDIAVRRHVAGQGTQVTTARDDCPK